MEVHKVLGFGFLEPVYQEAMEVELHLRSIPFEPQVPLTILYKRQELKNNILLTWFATDKSSWSSRRWNDFREGRKHSC